MFESETVDNTKVDLKDVGIIKRVCDTFFLRRSDRQVLTGAPFTFKLHCPYR
jgi:hypothetical protein